MTVKELIEELQKYPEDMLVATDFDPHETIELHIRTWIHSNYPYNLPDIEYLSIE